MKADACPETRPASFDADLLKYQPTIARFCSIMCGRDREKTAELIQETNLACLRLWTSYRPEAASLGTWAVWMVRDQAKRMRGRERRERAAFDKNVEITSTRQDGDTGAFIDPSAPPPQEDALALQQVLAKISDVKNFDDFLAYCEGHTLEEIGMRYATEAKPNGITRQRAQQRVAIARAKVEERLGPA